MKNIFKSLKKKNNKGFTLVELVIVVAILAILVGILAPQYTKYVEKSRKAADASNLENLVTVMKTLASDSTDSVDAGTYTIAISKSGASIKNGTTALKAGDALYDAVTELAGDEWATTTLKSKKWTGDDGKTAAEEISATMTVDNNGKVSVSYSPKTLKNAANAETK